MAHLTMWETLKSIKMNQFKYLFISDAFNDTVSLFISHFTLCADVAHQIAELKTSYVDDDVEVPQWIDDLAVVSDEMKAIAKEVLDPMFDGCFY